MDGNIVTLLRSPADRERFKQMIVRLLAEMAAAEDLTDSERESIAGNIWTAWASWGDSAGLIPMKIYPPAWLTDDARKLDFAQAVKAGAQEIIDAYRAVVVRERLVHEIELAKSARRSPC
jgi:hypothetical protein